MIDYIHEQDRSLITVKWPHGGWIIWNWPDISWDHKTDDERHGIIRTRNEIVFHSPLPNLTRDGDGFYVSYNSVDAGIYGDVTTALVVGQMERFYILNGDHQAAYRELIPQGFDACLAYFNDHADQKNRYSDRLEA